MKWHKNRAQTFIEQAFTDWGWDFIPRYEFAQVVSKKGGRIPFSYAVIDKSIIPWTPLLLIDLVLDGERSSVAQNRELKKAFVARAGLPYVELHAPAVSGMEYELFLEDFRARIEQTSFDTEKV